MKTKIIIIFSTLFLFTCTKTTDFSKKQLSYFYNEGDTIKLIGNKTVHYFFVERKKIHYNSNTDYIFGTTEKKQACVNYFYKIQSNEEGTLGGKVMASGSFSMGLSIKLSDEDYYLSSDNAISKLVTIDNILYDDVIILENKTKENRAYINPEYGIIKIESDTSDIVYRYVE